MYKRQILKQKEDISIQINAIEALEGSEAAVTASYGHINIRLRLDYRLEENINLKQKKTKTLKSLIQSKGQITQHLKLNPNLKRINPPPPSETDSHTSSDSFHSATLNLSPDNCSSTSDTDPEQGPSLNKKIPLERSRGPQFTSTPHQRSRRPHPTPQAPGPSTKSDSDSAAITSPPYYLSLIHI